MCLVEVSWANEVKGHCAYLSEKTDQHFCRAVKVVSITLTRRIVATSCVSSSECCELRISGLKYS